MKKTILSILLVILIGVSGFAFFPFDLLFGKGVDIKTEVHSLKDSTEKKFSDIKAGLNDLSNQMNATGNEVGVLKDNQLKLNTQVELANKAIAGANNQISDVKNDIKAGRDVTQGSNNATTQTNDTNLMMFIIKTLGGICGSLIGVIMLTVKKLFTVINQKDFYKEQAISRIEPTDLTTMREAQDSFMVKKSMIGKTKTYVSKIVGGK